MEWFHSITQQSKHLIENPTLQSLVLFALTFFGLNFLKNKAFRNLGSEGNLKSRFWDDKLMSALSRPLRLGICGLALVSALQVYPETAKGIKGLQLLSKMMFIVAGFWALDRLAKFFLNFRREQFGLTPSSQTLVLTLMRVVIFGSAVLIILDTAGISITPLLASLGIGSLAVALALQDTLGNLFSGIYLLIDKPIRVGDYVRFDSGVEGSVVKIGWRSTHVLLPSNNTVILPNSKVATAQITNFYFPDLESSLTVTFGVAYASDLEKVEALTLSVAKEIQERVPGAVPNFLPVLRFTNFADSAINLNVVMRVKNFSESSLLVHEFIKAVKKKFDAEKIDIPFPQRVIWQKNS